MILPKFEGYTAVIVGTGPSLTHEQTEIIRHYRSKPDSNIKVFGINNTFELDLTIDVFFACNPEWWDHYAGRVKHPRLDARRRNGCDMWTWDIATARRYDLNWIEGRWSGGKRNVTSLSTDPSFIHYGHGAGYEVLGVAYHYGVRRFVLAGYDLRYPRRYDRMARKPGGRRHFFGEYPPALQHWPKAGPNGEMTGLLDCYRTVDCDKLGLTITNCSPGTALDFFETGELSDVLEKDHEEHRSRLRMD